MCHRLPRIWARVLAGQVKVGYARQVAQQTRHLCAAAAGIVDGAVVESADGRIPWARFERVLAGAIVAADPQTAARREAAAAQFAKATRSTEDAMKGFYLRAPAAVVIRFDATVAYLAAALAPLGDGDSLDLRRVKACLIMANPTQAVELMAVFAAHHHRRRHRRRHRHRK